VTNKHTLTVTQVDHDSWYGYYINDTLYGYNDSYYFSKGEVINEGLLRMFEAGLITHRDQVEVVFQEKYDLPGYSHEADDALMDQGMLPATLEELKEHYRSFEQ
jgi:hypothetical protein